MEDVSLKHNEEADQTQINFKRTNYNYEEKVYQSA